MATLNDIRNAVVVTLNGIPQFRAYDVWPDATLAPPCAVVMVGNPAVVYDDSFDGTGIGNIIVKVFVTKSMTRTAQEALDAYIMPDNDLSISNALEGTLNGLVSWFTVKSAENYGEHVYADQSYLGIDFVCEVGF